MILSATAALFVFAVRRKVGFVRAVFRAFRTHAVKHRSPGVYGKAVLTLHVFADTGKVTAFGVYESAALYAHEVKMLTAVFGAELKARTAAVRDDVFPHDSLVTKLVKVSVDGSSAHVFTLCAERFDNIVGGKVLIPIASQTLENALALFCLISAAYSHCASFPLVLI